MLKKETKKTVKKIPEKENEVFAEKKSARYVEAVGRRKTSVARVRITGGHGKVVVNGRELKEYFVLPRLQSTVSAPLRELKINDKFDVEAKVLGGGINSQAEAMRLGLSRALVSKNEEFKKRLHKIGFLRRDPRMVERKKYGLKKARRAPQWAKR